LYATVNTPDSLQHTLPSDAGSLQFNFYHTSTTPTTRSSTLVKINLPPLSIKNMTTSEVFRMCVDKYKVPLEKRFALLARVRLAKNFATQKQRQEAVRTR